MYSLRLFSTLLSTLTVLLTACQDVGTETSKPNVLFIAVDDLNDWVDVLGGHPGTRTPHINRLAAQGTLFTRAYCAAPACNPSRVAVLTGIRPSTSGVYNNNQPMRQSPALANAVTLPQYFRQHGYEVMGSGKIFHGSIPDPDSWDRYWPSRTTTTLNNPERAKKVFDRVQMDSFGISGAFSGWDWGPLELPDSAMPDWKVTDWVIDELQKEHEKPFFLACGIYKPHLKWNVPAKYFDLYPLESVQLPLVKEDDLEDIPPAGRAFIRMSDHRMVLANDQWHRAVQAYQASITFADACVGRVLDALERSPHHRNTIVVLWSDHGYSLGEKQHWRKFALWEDVTRSVLLVNDTREPASGQQIEQPVSLLDIYPTLLSLCGLPPKQGLEGNDLRPLMERPDIYWDKPVLMTNERGNHSLRWREWHYIRYADGSEELYNLAEDPHEWENLAHRNTHTLLKRKLATWLPAKDAEPARKLR